MFQILFTIFFSLFYAWQIYTALFSSLWQMKSDKRTLRGILVMNFSWYHLLGRILLSGSFQRINFSEKTRNYSNFSSFWRFGKSSICAGSWRMCWKINLKQIFINWSLLYFRSNLIMTAEYFLLPSFPSHRYKFVWRVLMSITSLIKPSQKNEMNANGKCDQLKLRKLITLLLHLTLFKKSLWVDYLSAF